MASDIFNWGSNEAYERLGALAAWQRWHSFDVSADEAIQGKASRFVMAVWNYHFDPVTRERKDWAIKVDGEGGYWYPVRWSTDSVK